MNKAILIIIAIAVVLAGGFLLLNKNKSNKQGEMQVNTTQNQTSTNSTSSIGKNQVTIQGFAFSPATITVKVGDSITWENSDSAPHSATADDGNFDTGRFGQGESKTVTFDKAGTFNYHCSVHPNMKATVVVE